MHWNRARENIREQLGCSVQQLAQHYKCCLDIGGCGIVDTTRELLDGEPARILSAKLREKFAFCIQGRYDLSFPHVHNNTSTPTPTVPHRRPLCLQTWCGNTRDAAQD